MKSDHIFGTRYPEASGKAHTITKEILHALFFRSAVVGRVLVISGYRNDIFIILYQVMSNRQRIDWGWFGCFGLCGVNSY